MVRSNYNMEIVEVGKEILISSEKLREVEVLCGGMSNA